MPSIQNAAHQVSNEIVEGVLQLRKRELAALTRHDEIYKLSRLNRDERKVVAEIQELEAHARGISAEMLRKLRDIRATKFTRVKQTLNFGPQLRNLPPIDPNPPQPASSDPTFWWARTDWSNTARTASAPDDGSAATFSADLRDDGLHYFGQVSTHDGDHYSDHFGAVALFELQANRIPQSQSGLWSSTPHVELSGGLLGYTSPGGVWWGGDSISNCWMSLRQQLFQWGFGQDGPAITVVGENQNSLDLIDEWNMDRTTRVDMPGFQWMPAVSFDNSRINLASSLWARLEIRFDIQTEGAGSVLSLDPEILLRTLQWPLNPA